MENTNLGTPELPEVLPLDPIETPESLDQTPESTPEAPSTPEPEQSLPPEVEALIAEAEQRGYARGVNERLSRELNRPDLYADLARYEQTAPDAPRAAPDDLTSAFLANIRPGVWD